MFMKEKGQCLAALTEDFLRCREIPADHRYLSRTEDQLVKLPGKKFQFTEQQMQVRTQPLPIEPGLSCWDPGWCEISEVNG